jgi:hypothetical protein
MRGPRPLSTGESGQSKHGVQIELRVGLALAWLLLAACAVPVGTPDADELNGGILVPFDVVGGEFHVWVTNPQTTEQSLDLQQGTSPANIPNERTLHGPGRGGHKSFWSWHLDPAWTSRWLRSPSSYATARRRLWERKSTTSWRRHSDNVRGVPGCWRCRTSGD